MGIGGKVRKGRFKLGLGQQCMDLADRAVAIKCARYGASTEWEEPVVVADAGYTVPPRCSRQHLRFCPVDLSWLGSHDDGISRDIHCHCWVMDEHRRERELGALPSAEGAVHVLLLASSSQSQSRRHFWSRQVVLSCSRGSPARSNSRGSAGQARSQQQRLQGCGRHHSKPRCS